MAAESLINARARYPRNEIDHPSSSHTNYYIRQADLLCKAERAFLEGRFRNSLQLANQAILDEIPKNTKSTEIELSNKLVRVGCAFSFDSGEDNTRQRRTFIVSIASRIEAIDQIAAIALQSWHEINSSQHEGDEDMSRKNITRQGCKHLLPFFNLYSNDKSACRPIPLELMVVFLQFCHADDMAKEAISLGVDLIAFLMSDEAQDALTTSPECSPEVLNECKRDILVVLLTRLLPYLKNPQLTHRILVERIFYSQLSSYSSPPPNSILHIADHVIADEVNHESLSLIISVLRNVSSKGDHSSWWNHSVEESLICLDSLQQKYIQNEAVAESGSDMLQSRRSSVISDDPFKDHIPLNFDSLPPTQRYLIRTRAAITHQLRRLVELAMDKLSNGSNDGRTNSERSVWAGKVAFSLALMLLAWKRKRLLRRICNQSMMVLLSPVVEVVEALMPDRSNASMMIKEGR